MNIKCLSILVAIHLFGVASADEGDNFVSPRYGINSVIAKGQEYVSRNKIDVSNKSITSVVYHSDFTNNYNRPYWEIHWSVTVRDKNSAVKGGTYTVTIYDDGEVYGVGGK